MVDIREFRSAKKGGDGNTWKNRILRLLEQETYFKSVNDFRLLSTTEIRQKLGAEHNQIINNNGYQLENKRLVVRLQREKENHWLAVKNIQPLTENDAKVINELTENKYHFKAKKTEKNSDKQN